MTVLLNLVIQGTLAGSVALIAARIFRNSAPSTRIAILFLGLAAFALPLPRATATTIRSEAGAIPLIAIVMVTGIAFSMVRLAIDAMRLRTILMRSSIAPIAMQERLIAIAAGAGVDSPLLLVSHSVIVPFVTQRAIVLPASLLSAPADRVASILSHELGHVRFRDVLAYRLLACFAAVFWFHPVVHAIRRLMGHAIEERCDDFVLRQEGVDARDYAETLVELAAGLRDTARLPAAAMASAEIESLAARLRRIASTTPSRRSHLALLVALSLILLAAVAAPGYQPTSHTHHHIHLH